MHRCILPCLLVTALGAGEAGPVRHVILLIGDGMNLAHEVAASRYRTGRDRALAFHALPYSTAVTTWDISTYDHHARIAGAPPFAEDGFDPRFGYDPAQGGAEPPLDDDPAKRAYYLPPAAKHPPATDSAAAATALATGRKTGYHNLSWRAGDPPDGAYATIADLARTSGRRIGVVSTVPLSHATPAAFVAHNQNRFNTGDRMPLADGATRTIDDEIIRSTRPDVAIAGGFPGGPPGKQSYLTWNLLDAARADPWWEVVLRADGAGDGAARLDAGVAAVLGAPVARGLLAIFGGRDGQFEVHRVADAPGTPAVSQGSPDNPGLAACTTAALRALTADGHSPRGCFAMIEQGDIDWSNHGNDFPHMIGGVLELADAVEAAIAFIERPDDAVDWGNTLLIVTADHSNSYMRLHRMLDRGDLPPVDAEGRPQDATWVSYGTDAHTNEPVMLYARGAGIDRLRDAEGIWYPGTRLIDNTQVFWAMADAMGLAVPAANGQHQRLRPAPVPATR